MTRGALPTRDRRLHPILLLESATLLSGAGNGVPSIALPWLILERTGSAVAAGFVAAATALPLLVSSLFSGTLVDGFGRRRMAVVSDLLSAIAAANTAGWGLDRANGIHEAVWGVAFLIGPGIGGALIATIGAVNTLWVTAAGFAMSASLIAFVRLASAVAPHADRPLTIWKGTREGLSFVWRDRTLRAVG